ncbi:(E3-independent) E2 ubiquitin-conjugating enzyme UBE2O isoform X2 [Eurosta solidaginis]|uniref:(E3-independent) E2 ubiquitin-conjugating enzyme UBE2O isoform X2 n=1 Tax=Eurosta solidaginis TaxID=178769 RepID=UPI0035313791
MAANPNNYADNLQLLENLKKVEIQSSETSSNDLVQTATNGTTKEFNSDCDISSSGCMHGQSAAPEVVILKSMDSHSTHDTIKNHGDGCDGAAEENEQKPQRFAGGQASSPADNQYFFEDEVFRIDKKGHVKFGLVIETSETYSGDEDDDFDDVLMKGEVRVAWYPGGKEEVQPEGAVALADRTLMPGDVVRRLVPGKDTQRGYCRDISMHADVKVLGTKYVIKNVMTERLRPINVWQRDSAVCLDSWVGSTKDVEQKAVLRSTAGARVEISSNNFYGFSDYNSRNTHGIYNPHVFYPGNVVIGRLPALDTVKVLTPSIPIHKNKKGKPIKGKYTIEAVETDSVWVHWQCKALSEESKIDTSLLEQPNPCVSGEDLLRLKRLNLFESCMLQISDRNYLKFSKFDTYIKKSQWEKEQETKFKVALAKMLKSEYHCTAQNASSPNITSNTNSTHNTEKTKKKFSLTDVDSKTIKLKKSTLKADKLSSSNSKDKTTTSHEPPTEHSASNLLNRKISKSTAEPEWVTDDEDDDEVDDDDDDDWFEDELHEDGVSTTTCSSSSPHHSPKHSKRRLLKRKSKAPVKRSPTLTLPDFVPRDGDELVTEALLVYSTATVVWQDGSIEAGIPSTQLYPIHHLDNHEFFPGDFVVSSKEDVDMSYRDYGVIQKVDHEGRTARVKWFTTYTSADEPRPAYNGETEVSVYDLKDHPDFQYRPGTMVIRVANFSGEDATCTAGQIIDNYVDGRAKVWWVDGHISMCWPQDLFEVGQYDHADWGHESEDSWETESENSELGCSTPKIAFDESHIITNIERTRVAIARLEEIFNISPNLQNAEVMRTLLKLYKGCRYLDRLLNTSFFHEDNFMGLIERVRKGGTQSISERAQDRKNRLFSYVQATSPNPKQQLQVLTQPIAVHVNPQQQSHYQAVVTLDGVQKTQGIHSCTNTNSSSINLNGNASSGASKEYAPKILFNISSTPCKPLLNCNIPGTCSSTEPGVTSSAMLQPVLKLKSATSINSTPLATSTLNTNDKTGGKQLGANLSISNADELRSNAHSNVNVDSKTVVNYVGARNSNSLAHQQNIISQNNQLLNSAMMNIEKAFEKTCQLKSAMAVSQDDSGNYSRNENCDGSSTSYASYYDLTNVDANVSLMKVADDQNSISCSSFELNEDAAPEMVCVRLCALLKEQLVKCIQQIREKFYKGDKLNLSEVCSLDDESYGIDAVVVSVEKPLKPNDDHLTDSVEVKSLNIAKSDEAVVETIAESAAESQVSVMSSANELPRQTLYVPSECFQVLPQAPSCHKYQLTIFHPNNPQQYYKAVQREHRLLKSSLPPGVWVRVYEDRMDLLSVMIEGPEKTPYEDGLFFFDIQLGREYPKSPPLCHYISYCSDRLNPNLYEDGKVCVSLLGTWAGRDSEVWGPNSTLLQVIVSIQGLILVPEPYFNEAGYEKQKDFVFFLFL